MTNEVVWESRGLVHYFSGQLSAHELLQAIEFVHADPRFDLVAYAIADFSACTDLLISDEDNLHLAAITGAAALSRKQGSMSAFIVNNPKLIAFFDYFIQSGLAPDGTRRFSSLDEARQWITNSVRRAK